MKRLVHRAHSTAEFRTHALRASDPTSSRTIRPDLLEAVIVQRVIVESSSGSPPQIR